MQKIGMLVVMVYLQPFCHNSLLKRVSQLKITKNSLKQLIFGVQSHHCWHHYEARHQCLLW